MLLDHGRDAVRVVLRRCCAAETTPSVETRQSMQASYKSCKLVRDKHGGNSLSNTSVLHMNLQTYRLQ